MKSIVCTIFIEFISSDSRFFVLSTINMGYMVSLSLHTISNGSFISTNRGQTITKMKIRWYMYILSRPCQPQHCASLSLHSSSFCFRTRVEYGFCAANYYIGNQNTLGSMFQKFISEEYDITTMLHQRKKCVYFQIFILEKLA